MEGNLDKKTIRVLAVIACLVTVLTVSTAIPASANGVLTIDIKPGSYPNSINLGDMGVLPVAILGTPVYDVYTIDLDSITLGGTEVTSRGSAKAPKMAVSFEDVNDDGYMDLMAFFSIKELVAGDALDEYTTELKLEMTIDGGTYPSLDLLYDSVRVVPPNQ
jgi:hypothetical protein